MGMRTSLSTPLNSSSSSFCFRPTPVLHRDFTSPSCSDSNTSLPLSCFRSHSRLSSPPNPFTSHSTLSSSFTSVRSPNSTQCRFFSSLASSIDNKFTCQINKPNNKQQHKSRSTNDDNNSSSSSSFSRFSSSLRFTLLIGGSLLTITFFHPSSVSADPAPSYPPPLSPLTSSPIIPSSSSALLPPSSSSSTPSLAGDDYEIASLLSRSLSFFFDQIIFFITVQGPSLFLIQLIPSLDPYTTLISLSLSAAYDAYFCLYQSGRTPAKWLMNLRTMSEEGDGEMDLKQWILNYGVRSLFLIDWMWGILDVSGDNKLLHNRVSGTVVVKKVTRV